MNTPDVLFQYSQALMQLTLMIMAGLYFIFSNTVMKALEGHEAGADVMVHINKVILNPLFLSCFCLSGVYSGYLALFSEGAMMISGIVFFVGTTVVTALKNVPLNNRLLEAEAGEARAEVWQRYLSKWVRWNHLRTGSATFSCLLLLAQ